MKKKNDFNKVILLMENIPLFINSWQKMPVIIWSVSKFKEVKITVPVFD